MSKKINFNQIKNHLKDNKVSLLLLLAILLIGTGTTYALWQLTFSQTSTNVITTACFKIEFEGQNDINLENAFPVTDEEGKKLTPYDFTITNVCTSEANYYVNLETVTSAEKKLSDYHLKANLLKGDEEVFLGNLNSSYINTERVISTASEAYKLYQGYLKVNETATFHLNLWLDDASDLTDEVMNATYEGKITVTTSYKEPVAKNLMIAMELYNYGRHCDSGMGGCEDGAENTTYLQNSKYNLTGVEYQAVINPYENADEVVDFSLAQDRSVLGYYVKDENPENYGYSEAHKLYIQANGKIKVNEVASYYGVVETGCFGGSTPCFDSVSGAKVKGIENLDTSQVRDMSNMFAYNTDTSLDLSTFDTSNVTNMEGMFIYCRDLTNLDISNFDTSKVTNMEGMFAGCKSLISLVLDNFDTNKVTNMSRMFNCCSSLTSLNVSSFDTSQVTDMNYMFNGMSNLTSLDLSNFDTSSVTNMSYMFYDMSNLTSLDLSNFDTNSYHYGAYV